MSINRCIQVDGETKGKMCELKQVFSGDDCKTESEKRGLTILRESARLKKSLNAICDVTEKCIFLIYTLES